MDMKFIGYKGDDGCFVNIYVEYEGEKHTVGIQVPPSRDSQDTIDQENYGEYEYDDFEEITNQAYSLFYDYVEGHGVNAYIYELMFTDVGYFNRYVKFSANTDYYVVVDKGGYTACIVDGGNVEFDAEGYINSELAEYEDYTYGDDEYTRQQFEEYYGYAVGALKCHTDEVVEIPILDLEPENMKKEREDIKKEEYSEEEDCKCEECEEDD